MKMKYHITSIAGLCFFLCLAGFSGVWAMTSEDCLGCHADVDLVGDDAFIDSVRFNHTVHAELGCETCHVAVTDDHPDDGAAITSVGCLECHEEVGAQYQHTAHAENADCTDCHNPHQAVGLTELSRGGMNEKCAACHDLSEAVDSHAQWLPQADLHIAKLPCITCHTSANGYEVVLNLTHKGDNGSLSSFVISNFEDLKAYSKNKDVISLLDLNRDHFISLAELRSFNKNPLYAELHLEGTLVPDEVSHVLTTHDNRYDCSFCHASGPDSMQSSYLALPRADGGFERIEVEQGAVLDALYGTPDFYMTGSTRSASLNIIGFTIICGGFVMPIGHGTLRFLTRKNRKH